MSLLSMFHKKGESKSNDSVQSHHNDEPQHSQPPLPPQISSQAPPVPSPSQENSVPNQQPTSSQIPELPPLDLPDFDKESSQPQQSEDAPANEKDLPQFAQDMGTDEPIIDDSVTDTPLDDSPSQDLDDHELPSLDDDEDVSADSSIQQETQQEDETGTQDDDESTDTLESIEVPKPQYQKRRFIDVNQPLFIEQSVYSYVLDDVFVVKEEVIQIQKFSQLLSDLNERVDQQYTQYQTSLSQMQKKLLHIEKKLFEKNIG